MKSKKITDRIGKIVFICIIGIVAVMFILPLLATLSMAFKSNEEILNFGILSIPKKITGAGFYRAFFYSNIGVFIKNSIIITVFAVIGSILLSSFVGFSIIRYSFKLKGAVLILFFAGTWFPAQTFLVPVYFLMQKLGLYDTRVGLIIAHIAYSLPVAVLIISSFFQSIEKSILEAAIIDGANDLQLLFKIVMPISVSALLSVAILQFAWIWNDLFWGLTITQSPDIQPVMIGITSTMGRYVFDWNGDAASALIAAIGPLFIFIFLQKYFLDGMRMGASK